MASCDVDADGNCYAAGPMSGLLITDPNETQEEKLYTLRSYDANGVLRWSWSDRPDGEIVGGQRIGPAALLSVRCSPGGLVIVCDDASEATQTCGSGATSQDMTMATALDTDGNVVWRVGVTETASTFSCRPYVLQAAGPTRSVWKATPASPTAGIWLIMDNATGAIVFRKTRLGAFDNPIFGANVTIDEDDNVYEAWSERVGVGTFWPPLTHVTRYSNDGATIDWSVTSVSLGNTNGDENLAVGGGRLVVGNRTYEEFFDVADGTLLGRAKHSSYNVRPKMVSADRVGLITANVALWRVDDGDQGQRWVGGFPWFRDCRALPDGGSLWVQDRDCGDQSLQSESDPSVGLPVTHITGSCLYTVGGMFDQWQLTSSNCSTGGTCNSPAWVTEVIAPTAPGDTVEFDCV